MDRQSSGTQQGVAGRRLQTMAPSTGGCCDSRGCVVHGASESLRLLTPPSRLIVPVLLITIRSWSGCLLGLVSHFTADYRNSQLTDYKLTDYEDIGISAQSD
ncbi:unnamed protein product [Boreogadus saida]